MKVRGEYSGVAAVKCRFALAAILLSSAGAVTAVEKTLHSRPNVLFLFSDDQRPDTIHALGNPVISTPNLDALVARGTTFTRATCAHPLCVPSRAELLTGATGFRNGVHPPRNSPDKSLETWPEAMKNDGYVTWWVGKWMISGRPSTRGYQESRGLFSSGRRPEQPQFDYKGREVTGYRGWMFQSDDRRLFPDQGIGLTGDISSKFASAAIEFIERKSESPFFLHVNFTAPHDPLLLPPGYEEAYDAAKMPLPKNFQAQHPFDHGNFNGRDERLLPWPRTPQDIKSDLAAYYAVISDMDHQIGRILQALEDTGQAKNTIVVFSSDHGLALGSHGLMGKQNMYEHTINVPLILAGPGIPENQTVAAQCYLRDLVPTICEMTGVTTPAAAQARSLVPVLNGSQDEIYPFIVGYYSDSQRMIRKDRYKYVWYPKVEREQLFDLHNDPFELRNLIDDPARSDVAAGLRNQLVEWLKQHQDPLFPD